MGQVFSATDVGNGLEAARANDKLLEELKRLLGELGAGEHEATVTFSSALVWKMATEFKPDDFAMDSTTVTK